MSRLPSVLFVLSALVGVSGLFAAPAPRTEKPTVEVVFCLDTTASMSGMLESIRASFWSICNRLLVATPTPHLRVGVVGFRDKGDAYVTRVFDLTDDLDAAYLELCNLNAGGGGDTPEHVNKALDDVVHRIRWSAHRQTVRLVYLIGDAAPHMDYDDDVKYADTCKKAAQLGLVVNTIQCGSDYDCAQHFQKIALLGRGNYAKVALSGGVRVIETPCDKSLAEMNAAVLQGVVVHGRADSRASDLRKLRAAETLPTSAAADRMGCAAQLARAARFDLLNSMRLGLVQPESLSREHLESGFAKMSAADRLEHLGKLTRARSVLFLEAHEVNTKRLAYLRDHRERHRVAEDGLDMHVVAMARRQVGRLLRF